MTGTDDQGACPPACAPFLFAFGFFAAMGVLASRWWLAGTVAMAAAWAWRRWPR